MQNMDITIRKMKPDESGAVAKLGLVTFHSMEGLFIGRPSDAVVAVQDEKIVAAAILKKYSYKEGFVGYVDYAFVDRKCHGKGIGNLLYNAAIDELKKQGCNEFCALVRGDNPGSFRLFEKMNMNRCTMGSLLHILGVKGMLKIVFSTTFGWGPSMDCYLSGANKKRDGSIQILLYLAINMLLLFAGVFKQGESVLTAVAAGVSLMFGVTIFESVIHLLKRNTYHFRLSAGGCFLTLLINALGGFFPLSGKWYPDKFENTSAQRQEMCISAATGWIGCLAICVLSKAFGCGNEYLEFLYYFSTVYTVFHMLPTFPFCEYAGRRVYQHSKILYLIMWLISAAALILCEYVIL